ncbi:hypothetical protein [Limisphaera sp. 4302-co]|uniref:hypothetical protein n=1 Tax=Limisphaera sp. 4302-co TaxID=3400417 RepID=UPI003C1D0DF9
MNGSGKTFRVLKDKELHQSGECHNKRVILELYDAMQEAKQTGKLLRTQTEEA